MRNHKTPRRKHRQYAKMSLRNIYIYIIASISSGKGNKSKGKQIGQHQTKTFCFFEGSPQQNKKATY